MLKIVSILVEGEYIEDSKLLFTVGIIMFEFGRYKENV